MVTFMAMPMPLNAPSLFELRTLTMIEKNVVTMAQLLLHSPDAAQPQPIGWLSQFGDNLRVSFDKAYVDNPNRLTLSQQYLGASEADTQAILTAIDDERLVRIGKLPAFFSNLLPEGHNRERLAQQRGVSEDDELELLAAAGHDLSGAVEVIPATDVPDSVLSIHVTKNLEPVEPATVAAPVEDGFSIDGVQTKFSMVHDGRRYIVRRGRTAGDFIAKLPSTKFRDLVQNEGICMRLAAQVGVKTAKTEVRPIAELDVPEHVQDEFKEFLLVHRFDRFKREDGSTGRIHFEELTQALGLDARKKYYEMEAAMVALLSILKSSAAATMDDFDEFFRRWTVNALMGNTDAHSKNWGLIYADGRHARLSPAYDLVSVASYFDVVSEKELSINRAADVKLRQWGEEQAAALAKAAGYLQFNRARKVVRDTMKMAAAEWPAMLAEAPEGVRKTISGRLAQMVPQPKAVAAEAPERTVKPRP